MRFFHNIMLLGEIRKEETMERKLWSPSDRRSFISASKVIRQPVS